MLSRKTSGVAFGSHLTAIASLKPITATRGRNTTDPADTAAQRSRSGDGIGEAINACGVAIIIMKARQS